MTIETKIAKNNSNVDTANELPTGNITVKSNDEPTDCEKFLKAKEQIKAVPDKDLGNGNFTNKWLVYTEGGWKRTNKENAAAILKQFGLTTAAYLAEKVKWVAEEVARGALGAAAEDFAAAIIAPAKVLALPAPVETVTDDNTLISMTQYKDLLAWAEKVSNGQLDAATQIKTHCATWLNADIDKATVIDIIKADDLNGFRNFLAQFNFTVKDDAGYIHKLHTYENGDCVLAESGESATAGNYDIQINGEWVYFTDHKITRIDAEDKLGFSFEYTLQGRKQFRHNGRVISRDGVIKIVENREIAKAQSKTFREFFINPDAPKHGFFQVMISPTFADGCEHDYARYFDYYADAINFVNDAIEFCGDVPTHITIKRDKQAGKVYYHRTPDGSVHIDKPDTDFFKNYSATEIKTRIDAINRAIKENTEFKTDCIVTGCNISRANDLLAVSKNFYEFVLHENKPEIDERITPAKTPADDFEAKLAELKAKQSAAKEKELAAKKVYKEAGDKYVECQEATQNFLDAHADKLTEKLKAIEIKSYITLVRDNGKEHYDVFSTNELYVYAFNGFGKMFLVRCRGNELGTYDTPAQIETVIERLKAAIERGDREFTFPTIEELTKPEVDKSAIANSLTRAMTIALENYQSFCRVGNLTAATNELSLYNICRKAMTELWKEEAA